MINKSANSEDTILEPNGLKLREIKSDSILLDDEPVSNLQNIDQLGEIVGKKIISPSFFVAYLDYQVLIGRWENKKFLFFDPESDQTFFSFNPKYLQKLRVFNSNEELFLWRSNDVFRGRLRHDDEGLGTFIIEAVQVLWGTEATNCKQGFCKISEERGAKLILPFSSIIVDAKQNRIKLKTRNYIKPIPETGQASYEDSRFVVFKDKNGDLY